MGLRQLINRLFPAPAPSEVIERYLQTGKSRWIDELFDGWVELDAEAEKSLLDIHERHGLKGDGFYGGLLRPEARQELGELARKLRQEGK